MKVIFTGEGGFRGDPQKGIPSEAEEAKKVFDIGEEYIVESGFVGAYKSSLIIKGHEGEWNSVLFKNVDLTSDIFERSYAIYGDEPK